MGPNGVMIQCQWSGDRSYARKVGDGMKGQSAYRGDVRASTSPLKERRAVTDTKVGNDKGATRW